MSSSSSSSHPTVTYTPVSTDIVSRATIPTKENFPSRPLAGEGEGDWFHLMEAYKTKVPEAAPQSPDHAPYSPVPAPEYLEYMAPLDKDIAPAEE
ncbi:hypothetical protein Tco_0413267 [Tanacetum coccineum]